MHNIAKHARATTVTILIGATPDAVVIEIADDGVGFDPAEQGAAGHDGVRTVAHRAELIGGSVTTTSRRGAGTTVTLSLPLG